MNHAKSANLRVALFTMPFAPATRPSIQLGLLKAALQARGVRTTCFYPNVDLYARMRRRGYHQQYTPQVPSQVFEWYFSERPYRPGLASPDWQATMRLEAYCKAVNFPFQSMLEIKQEMAPELLEEWMAKDYSDFDLFGFTMTYPQITASLALARRLKERHPGTPILFGGAGSQIHEESVRELMRVFPSLDAAVVGEGEPVVGALVEALCSGRAPDFLPDVFYRDPSGQVTKSTACNSPYDMNDSIYPDYDEFFEKVKELDPVTRGMMERVLPIEMGRGCAWGDKRTCKFCAFTFHGAFRRRSAQRVLDEVRHQVARYFTPGPDGSTPPAGSIPSFYVVDDLVTVPMLQEIFPHLREIHPHLRIPFMEVRTAITEHHLDLMAGAGVLMVQPGVESMDDGLLEKMSKGTTVFHNLMFMKGCRERGIRVSHNIIMGFPDATTEDLENQLRHLKLIPHLDPPFAIELSFVRFSPYHHEREQRGFRNWRPDEFYRYLYPDELDIERIAYDYQWDREVPREHQRLYRETLEWIRRWQALWMSGDLPYLWVEEEMDRLTLRDGRRKGEEQVYTYSGTEADLVRDTCNKPQTAERLADMHGLTPEQVRGLLDPLARAGVVLEMRGRYLCLALARARVEALAWV